MNQFTISGNLTRDPEIRMAGKNPLCEFGIAHAKRRKKGNDWESETHFFNVIQWGPKGEATAKQLRKGGKVLVTGELRYSSWKDKQTGQTRSKIELVANEVAHLIDVERDFNGYPKPAQHTQETNQPPVQAYPEYNDPFSYAEQPF